MPASTLVTLRHALPRLAKSAREIPYRILVISFNLCLVMHLAGCVQLPDRVAAELTPADEYSSNHYRLHEPYTDKEIRLMQNTSQ